MGRKVRTVVNERKQAGNHRVSLQVDALPAGVYFYSLIANGRKQVKKMTLLR